MKELFQKLGIAQKNPGTFGAYANIPGSGQWHKSFSPIDDSLIGEIEITSDAGYEQVVQGAQETFERWRSVPAPKRGELVRQVGNAMRKYKAELGELVSLESGKILAEGEGEIQEAIDVADFSVGLSRQLYGFSMHSELVFTLPQ